MTREYQNTLYAEDVEVGDEGPELEVEDVDRVDFVKYAGASGDFNPIHVNEVYARDAGFPSVFGHGMLTAGIASHMVTDWLGISAVQSFRTRFSENVFPGNTLQVTGTVTDKYETDDGETHVAVEYDVVTGDGESVASGDATAVLPSREDTTDG